MIGTCFQLEQALGLRLQVHALIFSGDFFHAIMLDRVAAQGFRSRAEKRARSMASFNSILVF
eukprot:963086-Pleurochrysis_carterae.AAC.1